MMVTHIVAVDAADCSLDAAVAVGSQAVPFCADFDGDNDLECENASNPAVAVHSTPGSAPMCHRLE